MQEKISQLVMERFQKFKLAYDESLATVTNDLKLVADNKPIDTNKLYNSIENSVLALERPSDVFLFLHYLPYQVVHVFSHSLNVAILTYMFARKQNLEPSKWRELVLSGALFDVGMLLIDKEIIIKREKLNANEYEQIDQHSRYGYMLLKTLNFSDEICKVALMHHKRLNGKGYPRDVSAADITEFTKIITILDMYEAMTSNRVYRNALSPFEVLRRFQVKGFATLDPAYMLTFLTAVSNACIGNEVILSSGEIGEVVLVNKDDLARPLIKIGGVFVNLAERKDLSIIRWA